VREAVTTEPSSEGTASMSIMFIKTFCLINVRIYRHCGKKIVVPIFLPVQNETKVKMKTEN
jgi:hypothetical protein